MSLPLPPPNHVLMLSDEELNVVINALADLPYRRVAPLLTSINTQLAEQNQRRASARKGPQLVGEGSDG